MLILVGATVNVALNEGLFTTAKYASNRTIEEKEKELIQEGYSWYIMQEYSTQKTDDFDKLEYFFLGVEKRGVDITTLIDEENSVNGTIHFIDESKEINIVIKEDEDIEFSEDEKNMYIYFEYNNYKYKLVANNDNGMTLELKIVPKLQVQDASVKEEVDGWNIVFNSTGNTYDLLKNGNITNNKWWKITEEEKIQIKDDSADSGLFLIAENGNVKIGLGVIDGDENRYSAIAISKESSIYYFILTEKMSKYIEENSNPAIKPEMYEWYKGEDTGVNFKKYYDVSPISLSDLTDEQIYCKSYLEKIISSFEK